MKIKVHPEANSPAGAKAATTKAPYKQRASKRDCKHRAGRVINNPSLLGPPVQGAASTWRC
eukprot:scaffold18871_cov69-Phaeocystis_antarctica.AAC.9